MVITALWLVLHSDHLGCEAMLSQSPVTLVSTVVAIVHCLLDDWVLVVATHGSLA